MFDTKIKMRKGFFMNYHLGRWEGLAYTWQVLFKTVLLQCVHITGNYVPSHFIQTYIDCDHYLFVIPDYRRDDKKKGGSEEVGLSFFHYLWLLLLLLLSLFRQISNTYI